MKSEKLLDAMGKLSDELIEDAQIPSKNGKRRFPWKVLVGAAACFYLLVTAVLVIPHFFRNSEPLHYGHVSFLSENNKADTGISGESFRYIAGIQNSGGVQAELAPPALAFLHGTVHVVAKAVEELGTYETLCEYGSTGTARYRLFRMEVIEPLQSGLEGDFYYLLPEDLTGDLTQYDALLISMIQLPKNFVLRSEDQLAAFEYLFCDPQNAPELGNMIAFTDGIFDTSLWETWWQDRNRRYGYQDLGNQLDENDDLPVSRGSTLEESLQNRQAQINEGDEWTKPRQVKHYDFRTEDARQAMAYWKPFENGIFVPEWIGSAYRIRRYIGGCPTNEWYCIDYEEETLTASQYRFQDRDFKKLPDISAYIATLDLTQIAPQHTDTTGKELLYSSAVGWYEKTGKGVYSIVRIAWRYRDQEDYYVEYYDETFILLDETGDHLISKEELIGLIGENPNISEEPYGVQIGMPMV